VHDFDFDNLLLTVVGKGDKQRIVPLSFALRKQLIRFGKIKERDDVPGEWMFPARDGGKWHQRNALRSYYLLLERLGLPKSGSTGCATPLRPNTCERVERWCASRRFWGAPDAPRQGSPGPACPREAAPRQDESPVPTVRQIAAEHLPASGSARGLTRRRSSPPNLSRGPW
jgi:hypothetical protein